MDSEKRELCTAFLEALDAPPTIFYSNDCLYAILCPKSSTIRELVKISKDGSSRQSLFNFKDAGDFYTDNIVMHRGAIYISNSSYDENMKTHINV